MQIEAINTAGALAREGDGGRVGIFASEGTAKIVTAVAGDDRQFAQRAFGTIRFWVGVSRKKRCLRPKEARLCDDPEGRLIQPQSSMT